MTMNKHLICETCGGSIDSPGSAMVEWILVDNGADRLKIIHDSKSSPRGREGCSFHALAGHDHLIQDLPGTQFLDPGRRSAALSEEVSDKAGIMAVCRQLACAALESPETSVRQTAALALARMGDEAFPATGVLVTALEDEDEEVRFKAAFALKVLGVHQCQPKADSVIVELAEPMEMIDLLEPFVADSPLNKGLISEGTGLTGEVIVDVTGKMFLAPEEDYRGGGMGSVPLLGHRGRAGELVKVVGVFDRDIGIWVESAITL
jgi:hypothetical protein